MVDKCKDCQKGFKLSELKICLVNRSHLGLQVKQCLTCDKCLTKHRDSHLHFKLETSNPMNQNENLSDQQGSSRNVKTEIASPTNGNQIVGFGSSHGTNLGPIKNPFTIANGFTEKMEAEPHPDSPPPIYSSIVNEFLPSSNQNQNVTSILRQNDENRDFEDFEDFEAKRRERSVSRNRNPSRVTFSDSSFDQNLSRHFDNLLGSLRRDSRIEYDYRQVAYSNEANRNAKLCHLKVQVPRRPLDDEILVFSIKNTTNRTMLIQIVHWQPHDAFEKIKFQFPGWEKEEEDEFNKNAFELESEVTAEVKVDFSDVSDILKEWGEKNDAKLFPYVFFRALGRLYDGEKHDSMEWTIRLDRYHYGSWIPRFNKRKPNDHRYYKK